MLHFDYTIRNKEGLHAMPASKLAAYARSCQDSIVIKSGDQSAEASYLLGILALGLHQGTEGTVEVTGLTEGTTLRELQAFFEENL